MENNEMPLCLVHVSGRRVAWSSDPRWFPRDRARGDEYSRARRRGRAERVRESADTVIVRLLQSNTVRGVLVTGEGMRAAYVTRSAMGYRVAWSEAADWWPSGDASSPNYTRARDAGLAGIVYGLDALREVLAGGIVPERDWREEAARSAARQAAKVPSLEDQARARRGEAASGTSLRRVG